MMDMVMRALAMCYTWRNLRRRRGVYRTSERVGSEGNQNQARAH